MNKIKSDSIGNIDERRKETEELRTKLNNLEQFIEGFRNEAEKYIDPLHARVLVLKMRVLASEIEEYADGVEANDIQTKDIQASNALAEKYGEPSKKVLREAGMI